MTDVSKWPIPNVTPLDPAVRALDNSPLPRGTHMVVDGIEVPSEILSAWHYRAPAHIPADWETHRLAVFGRVLHVGVHEFGSPGPGICVVVLMEKWVGVILHKEPYDSLYRVQGVQPDHAAAIRQEWQAGHNKSGPS